MRKQITVFLLSLIIFTSCKKEEKVNPNEAKLIVKLAVNPEQLRLGNDGSPATIPNGNAAQNPSFNIISAHYLELAPDAFTLLGEGTVLYQAPETTAGGNTAINFEQSILVKPGETFLEIPLKDIQKGSYEWVRLSLSYQNYDVTFYFNGIAYTGTLASFVGFNTYINEYL